MIKYQLTAFACGTTEYIEFLRTTTHYDETAIQLAKVVNDEKFVSSQGLLLETIELKLTCDICWILNLYLTW